jgi:hypothetical protein
MGRKNAACLRLTFVTFTALLASVMIAPAQVGAPEWAGMGGQNEFLRLMGAGKFLEATPLAQADLAAVERRVGPDHPDLIVKLEQLGTVYLARGKVGDAVPLFVRSAAIAERSYGPRHSTTVSSLNQLMGAYLMDGRNAEAETILKRLSNSN